MELQITDRRTRIGELFRKGKYAGLSELGIEIIGPADDYDCANYVAYRLVGRSPPFIIDVLRRLPDSEAPVNGLVFYGEGHGKAFVAKHFGIYQKGKVESKWEKGPVFRHEIQDVPDHYGSVVMFRSLDDEVYISLQEAIHGGR